MARGADEDTDRKPVDLGQLATVGGLAAVFLGFIPGGWWIYSYYETLGASAVAADFGWQELVAPSAIICTLSLIAGSAIAVACLAISRWWPYIAPWRYVASRKARWFPNALIMTVLVIMVISLIIRGLNINLYESPLSGILLVAFVLGLFFGLLAWYIDYSISFGEHDQLLGLARAAINKCDDRKPSSVAETLTKIVDGGKEHRTRALVVVGTGLLLFVLIGLGGVAASVPGRWEFSLALVLGVVGVSVVLSRLIWEAVYHGLRIDDQGLGPVRVGDVKQRIRDAGPKYALIRPAILGALGGDEKDEIEVIPPEPVNLRLRRRLRLALAGFAILLGACLIQWLAGEHASLEATQLSRRILKTGEDQCQESTGERFVPFEVLSTAAADLELVLAAPLGSEPKCVWVLRTTDSLMWVAYASAELTVSIRPIPISAITCVGGRYPPLDDPTTASTAPNGTMSVVSIPSPATAAGSTPSSAAAAIGTASSAIPSTSPAQPALAVVCEVPSATSGGTTPSSTGP